jgi:hypothetical protein
MSTFIVKLGLVFGMLSSTRRKDMRLIHRMKIAMALLQELGGMLTREQMHGLLFLYCYAFIEHNHYYDFILKEGMPYSLQLEADKEALRQKKCLTPAEGWLAGEKLERFAVSLDFFEKIAIQQLKKYREQEGWEGCVARINEEKSKRFPQSVALDRPVFYTIGYEGRTPENYLNRLKEKGVALLCDVRKNAFSQKYGFSKKELQAGLEAVGIGYLHLPELGIISEKRTALKTDDDYYRLFEEYEHETLANQGKTLQRLMGLLEQYKAVAITCFEANICHCHRSRVALALQRMPGFCYQVEHL